jgi:hypothetical protein
MPPTSGRLIRIPDDVWRAAVQKARAEGTTASAVVVAGLRRYIKRPAPQAGQQPPREPDRGQQVE